MFKFACFVVFCCAPLLAPAAANAGSCSGWQPGPSGVVRSVLDGQTFALASGIVVRLTGILAPGGATVPPKALSMENKARAALASLIAGKEVALALGSEETDRYGDMLAQVYLGDLSGAWVQQRMVGAGLARVAPRPWNGACSAGLLAVEARARANRVGIWADPDYSVRDGRHAQALATQTGHYELVAGTVVGTGKAKDRVYLDFGKVWKDDFTVVIDKKAKARFANAGRDPLTFAGQRVLVRGWIEAWDGPMIGVETPAQIEVLGH